MTQTPADLRPLELGEILDRSATFWRAHFKALFALALGFELGLYALAKAFTLHFDAFALDKLERTRDFSLLIAPALWLVVLGLVYLFVVVCMQVAASRYVVQHALGEPISPTAAIRFTFSRIWSAAGAYFWILLWCALASLIAIVPYVISIGLITSRALPANSPLGLVIVILMALVTMVAFLLVAIAAWMRILMLGPILASESQGGYASFRRGGRLLSGRVAPGFFGRTKVRAGILLAVVGVILLVVGFVSGLPSLIVTAMYGQGGLLSPTARLTVPQAVLIPAELFQVAAQSVFVPINWVFAAIFYLDLRVRKEGLDLERKLSAMQPQTA